MFERFTDQARRLVVYAQEEARELKSRGIGTEHLLLGLLRQRQDYAARALGTLGVSYETALVEVARVGSSGKRFFKPQGHIPFTPEVKKALEESLYEAIHIGHQHIGTEHILLGLLHEEHGAVAPMMLRNLGAPPESVRQHMDHILNVLPNNDWT